MIHELKTRPEYFKSVISGAKPFEIRRNDRDFKVGDFVALNEFDDKSGYTGESALFEITYVMTSTEYVKEGFAVLGIKRCYIERESVFARLLKGAAKNET